MDFEHISPALQPQNGAPLGALSTKEFQQNLYACFEENGIIADLRSHLRVQMIKRLQNLSIDKPVLVEQERSNNFSLPKQAFNLVIAEHLLRERYHYTLSVFSTELPKTSQFPFALFEHKDNDKWKFDKDSVLNIIELIGISKCSAEAAEIAANYCGGNPQKSLLTCIITTNYCSINRNKDEIIISTRDDENNVLDQLSQILGEIRVPSGIINNLTRQIQQTLYKQQQKFDSTSKQYEDKIQEFKSKIIHREQEYKRLFDEQLSLKTDLKQIQMENKKLKKQIGEATASEQIHKQNQLIYSELEKLKEQRSTCQLKHCNEFCQTNSDLIKDLQAEIIRLQEINKEKCVEIEKLQLQSSLLVKDLENSRSKIDFLNSCLVHHSNQLVVGRSNLSEAITDGKRLKIDGNISSSSSSDGSDPTEKVLRQVRSRLQQLEQESEEIDKKFRKLKIKNL